jgi:adenylate cyclase
MTVTIFALVLMTARARRSVRTALAEARLRATLARYFAGNVVGQLAQMAESGVRLRDQHAAVLFADIRGFTSLAENMPAADVAQLLNEYRDRIAAPIARHGGTIDKFIGDGVMVVFGVPQPSPEDARNAVRGGLALQAAVAAWNEDRAGAGRAAIEVGIGIHFGPVVAGVLGERDRLEFTVIGDTVNVANRIEKHAARLGHSILVSSDVLENAPEERAGWDLIGDLSLRGRSQTVRLYAHSI